MTIEDYIKCPGCKRAVIPRLLFSRGDYMSYVTTQHICPLCGIVMYETGGGYKRGAIIVTVVAVILILLALVIFLSHFYPV